MGVNRLLLPSTSSFGLGVLWPLVLGWSRLVLWVLSIALLTVAVAVVLGVEDEASAGAFTPELEPSPASSPAGSLVVEAGVWLAEVDGVRVADVWVIFWRVDWVCGAFKAPPPAEDASLDVLEWARLLFCPRFSIDVSAPPPTVPGSVLIIDGS